MKKALAGVLVAAAFVGLLAGGANAQVPFFQVYFDDNSNGSYGETQSQCGPVNTQASLYLVTLNFNMFVAAVDYKIAFPPALLFMSDTYPMGPWDPTLNIGDSQSGNAVAYNLPRDGFQPMLVSTIGAMWTGQCNCAGGPQPLIVQGYPGENNPRGVRWPDYETVDAVGMTSLICPGPVSTVESTWGGIKALYR